MKTYYVKDLEKGLVLTNETFAVKTAETSTTKDGKTFYKLILIDKTGEIRGQIWPDKLANMERGALTPGKVVMLSGTVEDYRGTLQINVFTLSKVDETKLDEYMEASDFDLEDLWSQLQKYIEQIKSKEIRDFFAKMFSDQELLLKFKTYPAAEYIHHSFQGGLMEHVVEMLDLAQPLAKFYPEANFDLINAGIVLHDIGKINYVEPVGVVMQLTTQGCLIGHLVMSYEILMEYGKDILSDEVMLNLKHIVLAHHGSLEFGSPVVPQTIEANIVAQVDVLSSRTRIFQKLMRKASGNEALFTEWDKILGTRIYLGGPENPDAEL